MFELLRSPQAVGQLGWGSHCGSPLILGKSFQLQEPLPETGSSQCSDLMTESCKRWVWGLAESGCSGRPLAQDSQDAPGPAGAPFPTRMPFPGGRGVSMRELSGACSLLNHYDEGHWPDMAGLALSHGKSSSWQHIIDCNEASIS